MLEERGVSCGAENHQVPGSKDLPALPEGWVWTALGQLAHIDVGFAFGSPEFSDSGIRLLRGENIEPGSLRWRDTVYWPVERLESFEHLLVSEGQVVLAMDRPLIGAGLKIARAKASDLPCLLVQRVARLRFTDRHLEAYVYYALQARRSVDHLVNSQTGTQLPHVSAAGIGSCPAPLPPAQELEAIVQAIGRLFSRADDLDKILQAALTRSERLRQAILKRAFSGELVPQDPNDEPASVLLERIRAEREKTPAPKRRGRKHVQARPVEEDSDA
jgi:type I restriction enzyme S subunit